MRAKLAWLAVFAASGLVARPGLAADNDFRLNATRNGDGVLFNQQNGRYVPLEDRFRDLTTQLGFVFAPRLASPAETLGHSGFQIGTLWSGTFVSANQPYWSVTERGQRGEAAPLLHTLQLDVRKGLPFSFEIGASFMWLAESQLFAPGLEVRWALHEGFKHSPDLGLRGSVNHVVGNRDLQLTTIGLDGVVSKAFGLFGTVNVAPYLSWSLIFIAASSRVIDPTPTSEGHVENSFVFKEIGATDKIHHKLTIGVRTLYYVLNVSVQGEFMMFEGGNAGGVATLTTKLGLDF